MLPFRRKQDDSCRSVVPYLGYIYMGHPSPYLMCISVSFPLPASIKEVMVDVCIIFDVIIPVLFLSRSSFFSSLLCVQSATSLSSGFLFLIVALLGYLQALSCSLIPFGSHTVPSCSSANPSPDLSSLPFIPPPYLFPSPFHSQ